MSKIELGIHLSVMLIIVVALAAVFFNKWLPRWWCDKMGWHLQPNNIESDGCSLHGDCTRCGKHVMQDSQGNWF